MDYENSHYHSKVPLKEAMSYMVYFRREGNNPARTT